MLSNADAAVRASGAAALYSAAGALLQSPATAWMKDGEFRTLVCAPPHASEDISGTSPLKYVAGIAVEPAMFERIRTANGSPRLANVPPDQDAKEFELQIAGCDFDILTTQEPGGPGAIARFLQKFGEGIQQIEIYVRDVGRSAQILRERFALPPIYPQTRAGADGTRVNFFLVPIKDGEKVLVELVESPACAHS